MIPFKRFNLNFYMSGFNPGDKNRKALSPKSSNSRKTFELCTSKNRTSFLDLLLLDRVLTRFFQIQNHRFAFLFQLFILLSDAIKFLKVKIDILHLRLKFLFSFQSDLFLFFILSNPFINFFDQTIFLLISFCAIKAIKTVI